MCGIIGYSGNRETKEVLLNGLYALEYRGYDSSGIALSDGVSTKIIRSVGRVCQLEDKIRDEENFSANYGIAHTRWATNGEANLFNSHPHQVGHVTLVHNGIIENADFLRQKLIRKGYMFNSDTDTEVIAALLDSKLEGNNVISAINMMMKELTGSYALGIMVEHDPNLYAVRKDSPLLIGFEDDGCFLASDITAIIQYTNQYILLDHCEIAVLNQGNYQVYKNCKLIEKEVLMSDSKGIDPSKCGYEHYMLKEIMEEPIVLKQLIDRYKEEDRQKELDLSNYQEIDIVGCGSAMYAGFIGQSLIEEYAGIKVQVYSASEYRYKRKIYHRKTLIILISQSGETADTIAAMREAEKIGIDTLGLVNYPDSTIARECRRVILTNAGVEIAVATTKAYILQVCVLSLMAYVTAKNKGTLKFDIEYEEFENVPILLESVLERSYEYQAIANQIYSKESCFYIGRGIDYAICMEGSLKLKEVSYIHSEAYQAGELKHGTISLVEEGMPVLCVITDKRLKEKSISNLKEVEARGAKTIVVTTFELDDFGGELKIVVPVVNSFMQTILVVPVLQLLSYYVALNRGCDIDKPKNLAKSVTVE